MQSRRLLANMTEDSRQAQQRLKASREQFALLTTDIASLEAKLVALNQDLNNKKNIVKTAQQEVQDMEQRIVHNVEKKAGLCIR